MLDAGQRGLALLRRSGSGETEGGAGPMDDEPPVMAVMVMFAEPTPGWPDGDVVYGPMAEDAAYRLMVDAAQAGAVHVHAFPLLPPPAEDMEEARRG